MRSLIVHDPSFLDKNIRITPTTIGDLRFWFRADSILGLNDGDPVSTWPEDQFGNNASQGDLGMRPTFQTNISSNGLPAVQFDGSNDFLSFPGTTWLAAGPDPLTVAIVFKSNVAVDSMLLGNTLVDVQVRYFHAGMDAFSFHDSFNGSVPSGGSNAPGLPTDLRVCWWMLRPSGANYDFRAGLNDRQYSVGSSSLVANNFTINRISGNGVVGFFANGFYGEICAWKTQFTDAQIYAMSHHYFKPRWGLENVYP